MKTLRTLSVVVCLMWSVAALGQQKESVDLIVTGGIVVTMDGARAIYQDGSVAIRGDSVVAAGPPKVSSPSSPEEKYTPMPSVAA